MYLLEYLVLGLHDEQPSHDSDDQDGSHPHAGVTGDVHEVLFHLGIGVKELAEGVLCQQEGDEGQRQHGDRVGETVGDHRAHHLGDRCLLAISDIAAAPHFAQARKHEVDEIGAEDAVQHGTERGLHIDGLELEIPAQSPEDMTQDAYYCYCCKPPVVDVGLEGVHHAGRVHVLVQEPHQSHTDDQWDAVFHEIGYRLFHYFLLLLS